MAKNNSTETKNAVPAPADAAIEMTLDEFCLRMSDRKVDGRVELIHGFAYTERVAGHIKDTESSFKSRFVAFANKPV